MSSASTPLHMKNALTDAAIHAVADAVAVLDREAASANLDDIDALFEDSYELSAFALPETIHNAFLPRPPHVTRHAQMTTTTIEPAYSAFSTMRILPSLENNNNPNKIPTIAMPGSSTATAGGDRREVWGSPLSSIVHVSPDRPILPALPSTDQSTCLLDWCANGSPVSAAGEDTVMADDVPLHSTPPSSVLFKVPTPVSSPHMSSTTTRVSPARVSSSPARVSSSPARVSSPPARVSSSPAQVCSPPAVASGHQRAVAAGKQLPIHGKYPRNHGKYPRKIPPHWLSSQVCFIFQLCISVC